MKESLSDLFDVCRGDIISIVGSGGKTSMLFSLARELKNSFNVLITTSTKIFIPNPEDYDYLYTNVDSFMEDGAGHVCGITVVSGGFDSLNNKLLGMDDNDLGKISDKFDIVIIEADGSRNLPLKGWKQNEPPVLSKTNKTIGIIPISIMDKLIDESFIYGFEEFKKLLGGARYIDCKAIRKICFHREGLFKNSRGERFLFINQADDAVSMRKACELKKYIEERSRNQKLKFKICCGSLKNEIYINTGGLDEE